MFNLVPTARLALVGGAVAVAMLLGPDAWPGVPAEIDVGPWNVPGPVVVSVAALLLLALIDALLAGSPSHIEIDRTMPSALALAVPATVTWVVRNPSSASRTIAFADEFAPSLRSDTRRAKVKVPARGHAEIATSIRPARRGDFHIDQVTVRVDGPLGLGARQATRSLPHLLRVLPPFRSRDDAELRIAQARVLEVGLRSSRGLGAGTEFDQLRDYGPDDDFRRIDWAATARAAKPIVRVFRSEQNQRVVCLLDNGRVMAGRVAGVPRVEHAMDACLAVTSVSTALGDKCGLITFDREVHTVLAPATGKRQLGRVARALYGLEPALVESDYAGAFATAAGRFRRRAMLVVLTDLSVQAVDESLLPALPLLAKQHLVLIGAVVDPEVEAWATSATTDASSTHRRAAALAALDERRRARVRLESLGATVVDAAPERLAGELADAYLRFKSRGRL